MEYLLALLFGLLAGLMVAILGAPAWAITLTVWLVADRMEEKFRE